MSTHRSSIGSRNCSACHKFATSKAAIGSSYERSKTLFIGTRISGPRNGGCYPDGRPNSDLDDLDEIDGATKDSGSVQVMPGTHRQPLGEWRKGYSAGIEAGGHLRYLDLFASVALEMAPFQFHVFHSWIVHISGPNTSYCPRTGLVVRFVRPEDAIERAIDYFSCQVR